MKIIGKLIANFVGLMLHDVYTLLYFHKGLMLNLMNRTLAGSLNKSFKCLSKRKITIVIAGWGGGGPSTITLAHP